MLIKETKELCRKYNLRPLRKRGQNFLVSEAVINKIIVASQLSKEDTILEIGAGLGTLTKKIARYVKKVYAVEIDKRLIEVLKDQLQDYRNVEVIQGDIRNLQLTTYNLQAYKLIANLPYNITGLVIRKFLRASPGPKLIVLMLQKEVAERITAQPPRMNILAVSVQFYGVPRIIARVFSSDSWPRPEVDSVILRITPSSYLPLLPLSRGRQEGVKGEIKRGFSEEHFFQIVRAGFSSPRKYLLNNFEKGGIIKKEEGAKILQKIGLNPKVRAQELSIEDWIKLVKKLWQK